MMEFFAKYQKIFFAIGFLLVCLLAGYFIYSLFFQSALLEPNGQTATSTNPNGQLPVAQPGGQNTGTNVSTTTSNLPTANLANPIAQGGLTTVAQLNQNQTLSAALSSNGNTLQYYNKDDGKFYRIDSNGQVSTLTDQVFHDVQKVTWSPDRSQAILEYPDDSKIIYNFNTNKQVTLPSHWKDFNYSPSGSQIVLKSMGLDEANRWLAVTNNDGSQVKAIEPLGSEDDSVHTDWSPNNQMVAMYAKGTSFDQQEVYFIGLNNENFKSTIIEGRGFDPKWAPTGNRLVYSVYSSDNDMKPQLWVVDAQGDNIGNNRKTLDLETWASKCTFASGNTMYCAVPENLPTGAGLFSELAQSSSDQLYQVNIDTGIKKLVATPDGTYNMSNLVIDSSGSNLFFTDSNTQQLYKIKLK